MELPLPPSLSTLAKALSPSIASKQPGNEAFLSDLVAETSLAVMPKNPKDFSVDAVRVVKILGGSLSQSRVVRGMVFGREPDGEFRLSNFRPWVDWLVCCRRRNGRVAEGEIGGGRSCQVVLMGREGRES